MGTYTKIVLNKVYLIQNLGKKMQFNFTSEMFEVHSSYS